MRTAGTPASTGVVSTGLGPNLRHHMDLCRWYCDGGAHFARMCDLGADSLLRVHAIVYVGSPPRMRLYRERRGHDIDLPCPAEPSSSAQMHLDLGVHRSGDSDDSEVVDESINESKSANVVGYDPDKDSDGAHTDGNERRTATDDTYDEAADDDVTAWTEGNSREQLSVGTTTCVAC